MQHWPVFKPGFHYMINATTTTTTTTQTQSHYKVEQSSYTLIVLFWLKIGCCRGRNWLNGNQALTTKGGASVYQCLTLSGPAFSVVRLARGGSEAQMPKIKVNINQLKWNLAWVIMAIKAFLMQNLSLIALLVLEIWRHKISLGRRERVMKFGYLPPENGFNFKKISFYVQNRPMSISAIFKHRKNFSFSKFLGRLDEKRAAATPLIDQFC